MQKIEEPNLDFLFLKYTLEMQSIPSGAKAFMVRARLLL